ncbi:MAG TPA: MarR family transcriptional regulator [Paenibacillus sp.]
MDKEKFFYQLVAFTSSVHRVTNNFTKDVKSDAITPIQYHILEYLAVSQPLTLSQISECQHMSMPNTSREIKKLCEKNLCEKFDVEDDRRKQYIRLSKDGEVMMNEAFKCVEARFLDRIKDASAEELKEIEHALNILHTRLFY